MRPWFLVVPTACALAVWFDAHAQNRSEARVFSSRGVVQSVKTNEARIVIRHEAISNYMAAMTMPFNVKTPQLLSHVRPGDEVTFQLHVTEDESWIEGIQKIGTMPETNVPARASAPELPPEENPLMNYEFTNELGQVVRMRDFLGQALAITFIYTRCPLPDYCPRLSKNFQRVSKLLAAQTNAPANWHLLSVSFDPEFDTPNMLQAYGRSYNYDPARWSFLTGSPENISRLARASGVSYEADSGTINHNFRTLIIDATGRLQMVFPTGGDISDQIADQLIKAAAVTNGPAQGL